jgi:hypothetical protein
MFSSTVKITEAIIETAIMARQLGRNIRIRVSFHQEENRRMESAHTDRPEASMWADYCLDQAS